VAASTESNVVRPKLVVLFCVLCFIRGFVNMIFVAFPPAYQTGATPFLVLMTLGLLGCMFGFWLMKRWGVYLLAALVLVFIAAQWKTLRPADPALALPLFGLLVGAIHFKKMT
jgi:4-amino-4-deoxy-L-arabinose transferase-like glycosyltransferase